MSYSGSPICILFAKVDIQKILSPGSAMRKNQQDFLNNLIHSQFLGNLIIISNRPMGVSFEINLSRLGHYVDISWVANHHINTFFQCLTKSLTTTSQINIHLKLFPTKTTLETDGRTQMAAVTIPCWIGKVHNMLKIIRVRIADAEPFYNFLQNMFKDEVCCFHPRK